MAHTPLKLALRSFSFHLKANMMLLAACFTACAVLLCSFAAGDSLKGSLKKRVEFRLGKIESITAFSGGFFDADLLPEDSAAIARFGGAASSNGISKEVSVYGVDSKFWSLAPSNGSGFNFSGNEAGVSMALAEALKLKCGDKFIVSVFANKGASIDSAFAEKTDNIKFFRLTVSRIVPPENFGDISFDSSQIPPMNVFCSKDTLALISEIGGVNMALSKRAPAQESFARSFRLSDFSLFEADGVVKSRKWFLSPVLDGDAFKTSGIKSLSWFVSEFKTKSATSPFGFSLSSEKIGEGFAEINEALAKDLNAKVGDKISIEYFISNEFGAFRTETNNFEIARIFSMNEAASYKVLIPDFPGLTDADKCENWDAKIPIDLNKVREADKDYWNAHSYAPKILVSYADAKKMWASAYGDGSAYAISDKAAFQSALAMLSPGKAGFSVSAPMSAALANAADGVDFTPLFMGLSFFVIASCLILIAVSVRANIYARADEIKEYSHFGFSAKLVFKILFYEFLATASVGCISGLAGGFALSQMLVAALNGFWSETAPGGIVKFYVSWRSFAFAFALSLLLSCASLFFSVKSVLNKSREAPLHKGMKNCGKACQAAGILFFISAAAISSFTKDLPFKAAASLLILLGGIAAARYVFLSGLPKDRSFGSLKFALLSCFRDRSNTYPLFIVSTIAAFLLMIVGLNRFSQNDLASSHSASGGYTHVIKTAIPAETMETAERSIAPIKLHESSEANCLNLNRVTQPSVLGVDAGLFASGNVFSFDGYANSVSSNGWTVLNETLQEGEIPAITDTPALLWSLKMKLGDTVEYQSGGKTWKLRLVASLKPNILQGSLLVSKENFAKIWPQSEGAGMFLCKIPQKDESLFLGKFKKFYPTIETAKERMDKFDALQNSYLAIFLQLGIAGSLLGLLGVGILARTYFISQAEEHAFLTSCGWPQRRVAVLAGIKYATPVLLGSACASIASYPVLPFASWLIGTPGITALFTVCVFAFTLALTSAALSSHDANR